MSKDHYQELRRLKSLSTAPSVQKALDDLINNDNKGVREPTKRSKAEIQTIYITTGYAWSQNPTTVTIYINFKDASEISNGNFSLTVLSKSIELVISNHHGANHKFKINQLHHLVDPEKSSVKFKDSKIVITLAKQSAGKEWPDLRMKTVQSIYNDLERNEKKNDSSTQQNFDTPFKENSTCHHHHENK